MSRDPAPSAEESLARIADVLAEILQVLERIQDGIDEAVEALETKT